MEEKVFLIYEVTKNFDSSNSKKSIVVTSDTEEEVKDLVDYLIEGNVNRDIYYSYEEVKFVKKLKKD